MIYIHNTSAQILQDLDRYNTYVIMKTMGAPGHHRNGFITTQELGHLAKFYYICIYVQYMNIYIYIHT